MKRKTKNKILKTVTTIALSVIVIYIAYVMWNMNLKFWNLPCAISIMWVVLFIFVNMDNWLKDKRTRSNRESIDNSKYYFNNEEK